MHLNRQRIDVPSEGTLVKIYPFGDIHLGATNCDYERAEKVRDMIAADPNARWIGMGDVLDSITPHDKRWDSQITDWRRLKRKDDPDQHDESNLVIEQMELAERFFAPIWTKCLGFHSGNHEDMVAKYHFVDVAKKLCHDNAVVYLGYTALTRLEICIGGNGKDGEFQGQTIALDIFSEHGGAGGGTEGNAINQLHKRFEQYRADILLKGHVHRRGISKRSEIQWGPSRPIHRTRLAILTGHFLQGYAMNATAYPERKSMAPSELGSTVILIKPRRLRSGGPLLDAINVEAMEMLGL